jgi:predicted nucleotidyltransferase
MFKTEVQSAVQNHYDKLVELGYNVVGVFLYGSQNYELDYEKSDVDTKAIVLPTLNDIILNRQPVSTTVDMGDNCLCDVKDIRKMFECFKKQNINFIELLFTQYYVLNPIYKSMYRPMLDNAEKIARYNNYASLNCMSGMALEKYNALTHPYPSIKDKIDKYGYDNKQLHHILRIKDFIQRYIVGEEYSSILIPTNKEELLNVKANYVYLLEDAKKLAKESCDFIKEVKDRYMDQNEVFVNKDAENIMTKVLTDIIIYSIKLEVNTNE